jgi:hypothetical protein
VAALTSEGQVFSNTNVPAGTYSDFRAVLSFPIPDDIPRNAIVQEAQLTLVQLPSNDSATIPGFGNLGRGFFFLDPTPNNVPSNNVVLQEVTLGAPNNVVSSDFFAPASTPTLVVLSTNGNVLGGDVSAGPRTVDVRSGVQRAVSAQGPRFYQVRLQCAREVWISQVSSALVSVSTSVSISVSGTASGVLVFQATAPIEFRVTGSGASNGTTYQVNPNNVGTATITLLATNPVTVSFAGAGSSFSAFFPITAATISSTFSPSQLGTNVTISFGGLFNNATTTAPASVSSLINPTNLNQLVPTQAFSYTASLSASFSTSTSTAGTPASAPGFEISQGAGGTCRAEFDRGGAGSTTGPRLDITFTVPR